ncbi:MAG: hypothetical protein LBD02_10685 [Christensenellaceae bacterium]|jgi:hypothetical protein|nr:hypothetical protein [Christensenellaceae bacterium]
MIKELQAIAKDGVFVATDADDPVPGQWLQTYGGGLYKLVGFPHMDENQIRALLEGGPDFQVNEMELSSHERELIAHTFYDETQISCEAFCFKVGRTEYSVLLDVDKKTIVVPKKMLKPIHDTAELFMRTTKSGSARRHSFVVAKMGLIVEAAVMEARLDAFTDDAALAMDRTAREMESALRRRHLEEMQSTQEAQERMELTDQGDEEENGDAADELLEE